MPGPFEKDTRDLSDEELDRLLGGGANRPTWGRFAKPSPQDRRRAVATVAIGAGVGQIAPSLAMRATAARVRAANPQIFTAINADGGSGAENAPASINTSGTVAAAPGLKDVVNIALQAIGFVVAPQRSIVSMATKVAYSLVTTGKPPTPQELVKSMPVKLFEFIQKQVDKDPSGSGFQGVTVETKMPDIPAPPSTAVFGYDPQTNLLNDVRPGVSLPADVPLSSEIAPGGIAEALDNPNSNPYGGVDPENSGSNPGNTGTSSPGDQNGFSDPSGDGSAGGRE